MNLVEEIYYHAKGNLMGNIFGTLKKENGRSMRKVLGSPLIWISLENKH